MARGDLLLALVQSGAGGDELAFRRAAEALIAEENAKKHAVLASQLANALATRRKNPAGTVSPMTRPQEALGLLHETEPMRRLTDLVLPTAARQAASDVIEEHHRRDLLAMRERPVFEVVPQPAHDRTSITAERSPSSSSPSSGASAARPSRR